MDTRTVPTPGDIARHTAATGTVYDRGGWEAAVLVSNLPRDARHVALALAHYAGVSGQLPAGGGVQEAGNLAEATHIDARRVRRMLTELEFKGWIRRPDIHTWQPSSTVRPITLTLPSGSARRQPPHTGGADA